MDDVLEALGPIALGSRLKRLGERLQADAEAMLASVGVDLVPAEIGLMAALAQGGPLMVSQAAQRVGISQPAITRLAQGLERRGHVTIRPADADRRARAICLTPQGSAAMAIVRARVWTRLGPVVDGLCGGSSERLLADVRTVEAGLAERSMLVRAEARLRATPWSDGRAAELSAAFEAINTAWISSMFTLEPVDRQVLSDPRTHILDKGGTIWFAETDDLGIIGTCALMPVDPEGRPGVVELTKMGVREEVRGRKAGEFLLCAVLQEAQRQNITTLFLLTNSACEPAIHLYEKFGFRHDPGIMAAYGSEYDRCNVAMRYHPPA